LTDFESRERVGSMKNRETIWIVFIALLAGMCSHNVI